MKKVLIQICGIALLSILQGQALPDSMLLAGRKAYLEGDYGVAIEVYREYYRQAQAAGDQRAAADALRLIGDTFRASNEMEEALEQLNLGLKTAFAANDSALIGRIYNRLAAVYFETNDLVRCENNAEQAIAISEFAHDPANVSNSLNILGALQRSKGNYEAALDALWKSVEIQKAIGDTADIPNALNNIANTLTSLRQYDEAISVAKQSFDMASKADIPVYSRYAAQMLTESYRAKKDFEQALYWNDQIGAIDNRIFKEAKTKEISKLREEMDMAQKEKDLELLRNEGALKDQTIARQNVQTFAISAIGGLILALTVVFYITWRRQKQANAALKQKNEQIAFQADQISAINLSLEKAGLEQMRHKKRLEEINKVKDKLFSIISHDLRSPLNSIQGLMSLLKEGQLNNLEFDYMVDTLMGRVENTTMLLDNLLNWSRSQMEGFNAETEAVDLSDVTNSVCQLLDHNARSKNIHLENKIPEGLAAVGDRHMIDLVVRNLLSNAIKFTEKGGKVQIWATNGNGEVKVAVKDDGKGISSADLNKVMGEDYYFTLGTANEKGSGLGLRLCKEFLLKNNGKLWLEQNPEKGSTFWFSVPAV